MKFKDKVAIVTGAGRGIGEGIARALSAEGAKVVVAERTERDGKKVADELGAAQGKALFVLTDVSQSQSIRQMIDQVIAIYGKIDILVNNAGTHIAKTIEETSEEEWEKIQHINLRGTFLCSKYAIPHLRKTRGNIVHVASMVGLIGQSDAGAYAASKGGMIAMGKGMAIDFAKDGIRVNMICPGFIDTPLAKEWYSQQKDPAAMRAYVCAQHPMGRVGTIQDCAWAALFLVSEESEFITGITLNVDGGIALGY